MKSKTIKSKISTIVILTLLTLSMIAITLPTVHAQSLIMNCGNQAILNFPFNVDLNGPTQQLVGLKFAYMAPGATEWVLTTEFPIDNEPGLPGERYVTDEGGDCDIIVTFDQAGEWQVKWVHPATSTESNVVTVEVATAVYRTSYPYLGVIPNPVGVNQMILLHVGETRPLPLVQYGWEDLWVEILRPDGETDTIENIKTDATGGTGATYTPHIVGTYQLRTHFPEQQAPDGITQEAAVSEWVYLTVQADPIPYYPGHAMPTEYWTRPIDAELREWYSIAGNWRNIGFDQDPKFAPYNDGPETAHILWTRPLAIGGIIGGEVGEGKSMTIGDAYEGKFDNRLILAGRLYYTEGGSRGVTRAPYPQPIETICVDLHTGEEYWRKTFLDNRTLTFATTIWWDGFNHHGGFPYLFIVQGSTWHAFDAYSGNWRFTIEHVPSGDRHLDPATGEPQVLTVDTRNNEMRLWRASTWIKSLFGSTAGSWGNTLEGQTHDANDWGEAAYEYVVDIPDDLQGGLDWVLEDRVIGATLSYEEVTLWGLSTEPGREGEFLFQNTWIPPTSWAEGEVTVSGFGGGWMLNHDNVAVLWVKETREYYGFSLETGEYLWGPTEPQYYLDAVDDTPTESRVAAYGYFYSLSLGGIVYCYDIQTGETEWTYPIEDYYQEFLFANNWWGKPVFITDGKIYLGHTEHSPIDPRPRGAPFVCLDAYTGELIFRADSLFRSTRWGGRAIIGDSIMATQDTYDQRLYAVGKGPSALTVEMTTDVTTQGSSILVKGKVTDVSPGTEDIELRLRFPNGVPAVADESMSQWMLYVYKQFECPADVIGVDVLVTITDPNGDFYSETVTADGSGAFSMAWAPQIVGIYQVTVLFQGSESYYPSWATTSFVVDPTPAAPAYNGPSADDIAANTAQRTIAMLPPYPDVPTQENIADDAARRTIAMLPPYPQPSECPAIPAYQTTDIVIIVLVVVVIVLILYIVLKKQK